MSLTAIKANPGEAEVNCLFLKEFGQKKYLDKPKSQLFKPAATIITFIYYLCIYNMEKVKLKNEWIQADISAKGAELQSLRHRNGLEYLWQADANFWPKHSPVLFPIVGSLKNDSYIYEGQTYHLPRHGFARDHIFEVTSQSDTEAVFTLVSSAATLANYPFSFVFRLRYLITGPNLSCTYEVQNPSSANLWFSVGGHPAFAVPLLAGTHYTDYYLQFNVDEPLLRYRLINGLLSEETTPVEHNAGKVQLHHSLFYEDAIVMKHLRSDTITLGCHQHQHGVHFHYDGFPYLGIWAAPNAPFVCIEPWCGHADTNHHQQQLTEKEGIIRLPAQQQWSRTWQLALF